MPISKICASSRAWFNSFVSKYSARTCASLRLVCARCSWSLLTSALVSSEVIVIVINVIRHVESYTFSVKYGSVKK